MCILRSYVRQRDNLISSASDHIQRMHKSLTQMNIKLDKVISDITGFTGIRIIKAILKGEKDCLKLARLKHPKIKSSESVLAKALEGDYRKEHLFSLKQELELFEYYRQKIIECDREIEKFLSSFESKVDEAVISDLPAIRKPQKNDPGYDLRKYLIQITGVDVTKINGISASTAQVIISEIGLDMSQWKNEKYFASWLGICPNHKITGGKVKDTRSRKVVNRASNAFRLAARSAGLSHSAMGAFYRRIRSRLGGPIAVCATAHKIAKIFYRMLKYGEEFVEMDMEYYEKQYRNRVIKNLSRRAQKMGFKLIPENGNEYIISVS
jgi:transposase